MRRWLVRALLVVLLLSLAPLISVLWASWFANAHGCTLHEGFTNPCLVNGKDWGETLYTAFVAGWFMLLTLPVTGFCLLALLVIGVLRLFRRR
ncbi:hypothetical protein [Phaeovulum sp. W22_SRMD_FR3]|uniref:hypothetical protein n=1 Tax=Phaeovulum sp. W22_SRMD_FR3 TaxID=3240274 RepID=UPI003F94E1C0